MRKLVPLISCLFILSLNAQKDKVADSLETVLSKTINDSTKVDALHDLWRYYLGYKPEKSKEYAEKIIYYSQQINYPNGIGKGYLYLAIVASQQSDFKTSKKLLNKALHIFQDNKLKKGIAITNSNLATDYFYQSIYDSSLFYNKMAENAFIGIGDSLKLGSVYLLNSSIYLEKGFFELSLQNGIKSAQIFKTFNDIIGYAKATYNNACIYESLGNKPEAIKSYYEAIPILKANNVLYTLALAHQGLGILYTKDPIQKDSAAVNLNKAIALGKQMGDTVLIATALNEYGRLQLRLKEFSAAHVTYTESLKLSRAISSGFSQQIALLDMGELFLATKQYKKAEEITLNALSLNKQLGIEVGLNRAYENLYKIYKKQNELAKALNYYEKYMVLNDSIYGIEKANKINELQTIYETEKKEAALALQEEEIMTLNEKAKVDQLKKGLYAGGTIGGVLVSGLLFFGFRQRIKKNKIAREKQEEIYRQEIKYKKKELASQTLHLVQKNTFIQELMDNLQSIRNDPDRFKVEFRRIVMLLKKENASDKDWEVFKSYFAEVHNDFDQKLKTLYNDISEKEIRLAAFLRMNLTTKEIAATLNVLPDSILKSKYRLKKKLKLEKSQDLNSFLNSL